MTKQTVWVIKKAGENKYVLLANRVKVATIVFSGVSSVQYRGYGMVAEIWCNGDRVWQGVVGNKTGCRLKLLSIGRQYATGR